MLLFYLVKTCFDKMVDGEARSPARCRASNLRFEPSAVSPRAKPENPKGFQPPCHPHQFLLKPKRFPGAKTAGKRFLLWKMGFTKTVPCPRYIFALPESATPTKVFRRIPENRRNQPLQFMAAGFVSCPAAASGAGHCPVERAAALSSSPEFFDKLKRPPAVRRSFFVRRAGSRARSASSAGRSRPRRGRFRACSRGSRPGARRGPWRTGARWRRCAPACPCRR